MRACVFSSRTLINSATSSLVGSPGVAHLGGFTTLPMTYLTSVLAILSGEKAGQLSAEFTINVGKTST